MDPNALFWRTGRLVFRNAGLTEITTALSEYYGEAIQLEVEHPQEYTLTMEFERQSLSEIIEIICLTLDLEYEKTSHGFVLKE
jgi:ferric-dicitrate binding protein FerR (iron transport regulator)